MSREINIIEVKPRFNCPTALVSGVGWEFPSEQGSKINLGRLIVSLGFEIDCDSTTQAFLEIQKITEGQRIEGTVKAVFPVPSRYLPQNLYLNLQDIGRYGPTNVWEAISEAWAKHLAPKIAVEINLCDEKGVYIYWGGNPAAGIAEPGICDLEKLYELLGIQVTT